MALREPYPCDAARSTRTAVSVSSALCALPGAQNNEGVSAYRRRLLALVPDSLSPRSSRPQLAAHTLRALNPHAARQRIWAKRGPPYPTLPRAYARRADRLDIRRFRDDMCTRSFVSVTTMFELGCSSPYLGRPFLILRLWLWLGFGKASTRKPQDLRRTAPENRG
jgi:hypothetical protein